MKKIWKIILIIIAIYLAIGIVLTILKISSKWDPNRLNEEQLERAELAAGKALNIKDEAASFFTNVYFLIFIVIIASGFALGYLVVKEEHKPKVIPKRRKPQYVEKEEVVPDYLSQVRKYIKDCLNQGYHYDAIHDELIRMGWPKEVVDEEFANIINKHI